jgi:hypothetical protein
MLTDPTYLRIIDTAIPATAAVPTGTAATFPVISLEGTKAVRNSSDQEGKSLTITHSTSNENAGIVTERHLVRLDKTNVDSVTGKTITTSAYAVITRPRGTDNDEGGSVQLGRELGFFLLYGVPNSTAGTTSTITSVLHRIVAGEG